jgi:glycosyltransferase involved in cell wall biosynthesis
MRIVSWGTYDLGKPRVRILLRGLRENGVEVIECHHDVWGEVEDKSQIKGFLPMLKIFTKLVTAYPVLIWRYIRLPKHDAVLINYLGHLDVVLIYMLARLRGTPVLWDAFLSLYNTVVEDRKILKKNNPMSWALYCWEWLACRAADIVLLDTQAHADYFSKKYKLSRHLIRSIFVGVEPESFPPAFATKENNADPIVLFYGQFIPLHGIETIIDAAILGEADDFNWVIIGSGQEAGKIAEKLQQYNLPRLEWIPWVPYAQLIEWIHRADICLGVFGATEKASMVIPNKVFQVLSSGKPLITMDSPAIHELLNDQTPGVKLIPECDAESLIHAIREQIQNHDTAQPLHTDISAQFTPLELGRQLTAIFSSILSARVR